ncbi:TraI domain-containing protein [Burkholderia cenocepacia]|uniref:TraI domain-containing protein n=1 Tax=Burkholderia cenocepacia TaxID=95486 RepID=UPI0023B9E4FC|nr:TraI domain-containing protein [Burkholderia cenocepacia]MDF0506374.1 TraI domain-containing protein [Burkholderia cenocepacia]
MSDARLFAPVDAAELVSRNERRIELIAQCANESSRAEFDRKWMVLIRRCAGWFSSVPFGPDLYREPSGAFRWTVETAFYAMRLAGGLKFGTNLTSERRRRIEPQYNFGVFLAAICSGLDEPYRHFDVERATDCQVWNPSVHGAVGPWLAGASYRMARRATALPVERMRTGMLAHALVGTELLSGLDAEVQAEIFGAINPTQSPTGGVESLTHKVVRQAVATAAEFDRKAQRAVFEPVTFAVPSAIHVAAELEPKIEPATPADAPASAPAPAEQVIADPSAAAAVAGGSASIGPALPPASDSEGAMQRAVSAPAVKGEPKGADERQMALELPPPAAVNPAEIRREPIAAPATPAADRFDEILKGAPRMISDFFAALQQDVAGGKAKVRWSEKGLVVSKRTIGGYGVASDTLIEHMRRRSLLLANDPTEVTLAPRIGELIMERGE